MHAYINGNTYNHHLSQIKQLGNSKELEFSPLEVSRLDFALKQKINERINKKKGPNNTPIITKS